MKSYIEFKEVPTTTKTKRFEVVSKTDGSKLGEIRWHSPYRKYAFQVTSKIYVQVVGVESEYWSGNFDKQVTFKVNGKEPNVHIEADTKIFDDTCMEEISQFIKKLMEEREKK
jgi:hypothetical protein